MASATRADWATVGAGSCLHPLDAAAEYLRERGPRVVPLYVVAMAPFSAAMLYVIDVVTSQFRSALPFACLLLSLATLWRWGWLAAAQRRVQEDLRGDPPLPLWGRLAKIVLAKLALSVVVLWGSLMVLPAFYGFFVSGVAVPVLLESAGPATRQLTRALSWVHDGAGRLSRVALALSLAVLLTALATLVLQLFLVHTVLPSLLGLEVADLRLTVWSAAWLLCLGYFLFVAFDLYWAVASVMVYYDLQSRRLGSDLRLRLRLLREADE